MPKIIPHKNIEYTFRIAGEYYRLLYLEKNANGRLIFENVEHKSLTKMTLKAFRYYRAKCFISQRYVGGKTLEEVAKSVKIIRTLKKYVRRIEDGQFSARAGEEMKKEVGLSPQDVINDLNLAINFIENGRQNDAFIDTAQREYNFFLRYLQKYRRVSV